MIESERIIEKEGKLLIVNVTYNKNTLIQQNYLSP